MQTNDQGLPLPGKELDEWLWINVFKGKKIPWKPGLDADCPYCEQPFHVYNANRGWCGNCREWRYSPYQEYSTTHAFFQVMEAKRDEWHFVIEMLDDSVVVWLYDAKEPLGTADLAMSEVDTYNKTIVNAVAHAVCSCAWKARQHG